MSNSHIVSLEQVEETITSSVVPSFSFESHEKAYALVGEVLDSFRYHEKDRTKKEKISIRRYIKRFTIYSMSQITRLIREKKKAGTLKYGKERRNTNSRKFTPRMISVFSPKPTTRTEECRGVR